MRIHSLAWGCCLVYALTTVAYADDTITKQPIVTPSLTLSTDKQALFYQCAKISDNAGRLACFDTLHGEGRVNTMGEKRSLDLSETIISTIKGSPQVVLVDTGKVKEVGGQKTAELGTAQDDNVQDTHLSAPQFGSITPQEPILPKDQSESTHHDRKILTELGLSKEALSRYTPLSLSFDLDKNSERGLWSARPHNANYILPFYLHGKPNRTPTSPTLGTQVLSEDEMRDIELKFQLSLKTKAMENVFGTNADLWIGYTQQSHWQVYNENYSRPFRAHDYQPEVFLTQPVSAELPFGGRLRMLGVGGVHHSNGETDPVSRSWNRLYVMGGAEWDKLTVGARLWTRLKKREGSKPEDNPDITDYYGFGDMQVLYRLDKGKHISGQFRLNPSTKKGAVTLDYVYPLQRGISGYLQIFHGYGQSLVDYNHESTSIGMGIMLNDWLGL